MRNRIITLIYVRSITIFISAQASGGQIKRKNKYTKIEANSKNTVAKKKQSPENAEEALDNKYKNMSMISLEKYANQGDAMAQFYYGYNYAVKGNYETAVFWVRKAAYNDSVRAQLWLAYCYYNGKGVERDKTGARAWLEEAASKGSKDAKEYLRTWF